MGQVTTKTAEAGARTLTEVSGFQVVRLLPDGPAHRAGIVPYFDIITALDDTSLDPDTMVVLDVFRSYLSDHRDTPITFTLYNLYLRAFRTVSCTPRVDWGGVGLLGCSVEWAKAEQSANRSWHIVSALDGSPASHCRDIVPGQDYILGMQTPEEQVITLLRSDEDLHARIKMWHTLQRSVLQLRAQSLGSSAVYADQQARDTPNSTTKKAITTTATTTTTVGDDGQHNTARTCPASDRDVIVVPHDLLFLIYNAETNTVKEVLIEIGTDPDTPLGFRIASGLLHSVPASSDLVMASTPTMSHFVTRRSFTKRAEVASRQTPSREPSPPSSSHAHTHRELPEHTEMTRPNAPEHTGEKRVDLEPERDGRCNSTDHHTPIATTAAGDATTTTDRNSTDDVRTEERPSRTEAHVTSEGAMADRTRAQTDHIASPVSNAQRSLTSLTAHTLSHTRDAPPSSASEEQLATCNARQAAAAADEHDTIARTTNPAVASATAAAEHALFKETLFPAACARDGGTRRDVPPGENTPNATSFVDQPDGPGEAVVKPDPLCLQRHYTRQAVASPSRPMPPPLHFPTFHNVMPSIYTSNTR